ncbi:cation:proton antiporter [Streptomyces sedi]|uniref:Cation/H(+) antiporter n=1 Tax=Streptomyces sedi TaxID=555059 RepID=A0A5C4V4D9_9ACTN|nr:cation:proton antiporter [Streptomyces sedi]TNM30681.1 cation/H(+) antiporter [Streptomyces sedi]
MSLAESLPTESVVMADLAIVLLLSAAVVPLARRLRQPPVVGEIAVGIALGPSVLGLLPGDLPGLLFPDDARPLLSAIAQLGLLLFMFLAGWELDLARLRGRGRAVGTMAGLSMVVPFLLGLGVAGWLHSSYAGDGVSPGTFALYLGTAFAITAFPVLARVIRDGGLSRTRVGGTAMACAAIGDVIAWCVLALVVALVESGGGRGGAETLRVVGLTALYGLLLGALVRPLLRRAAARGWFAARGTVLALVVAGVLLSSVATTWIGVHAIFGAFAFGLVMPRDLAPSQRELLEPPLERVSGLLLPVFFVVTGLTVDIGALGPADTAVLALVVAVAVVGKLVGAALPARALGMGWREATVFGALMNTRGLTELVVLEIGRQLGVISSELFTMMVLMALLTTAMAGPVIHRLAPPEAPGAAPGRPLTAAPAGE